MSYMTDNEKSLSMLIIPCPKADSLFKELDTLELVLLINAAWALDQSNLGGKFGIIFTP